jgi:methylenetetrahydrofolate reductase (NADPH)
VYSFEIFPPKATFPIETIYDTLEALSGLKPDYISITYGAGGTKSDNRTIELANLVKNKYNTPSLAHLTAIHSDKEGVTAFLKEMQANSLRNILALRGDKVEGMPLSKDFRYASDLAKFISQYRDFHISGACYPEGHYESPDLETDIENLKIKIDNGVCHLNTQLFFDNKDFYKFIELARKKGIGVPVQAGVMPILNKRQIERIVSLSGVKIPAKFSRLIALYGDSDEDMKKAGTDYAINQIVDLIQNGADGIHLYIMNNAALARAVTSAVSPYIERINAK